MAHDDWKDCCRCCGAKLIQGQPGFPYFCPTCDKRAPEQHPIAWCAPMERQQKGKWDSELKQWVYP